MVRPSGIKFSVLLFWILALGCVIGASPAFGAYSRNALEGFQAKIVDHRHKINPRFRKVPRRQTRLIVIHTSELGLSATLKVVSKGKRFKGGRNTPGGHAHYVIARNGTTYRILDRKYRADHAGLSMWNGIRDVSRISVGIELVGYHYAPISDRQYRSLGMLLQILKRVYGLGDRDVLTHSQVAYGPPNPWFPNDHRGRKRCAKNFDRTRAGLGPTWSHDPDVRSGRLSPDPLLAKVFYPGTGKRPHAPPPAAAQGSNIISKENSAWSIAGEEYNDGTTVYILPGGHALTGDRVKETLGWHRLPAGTRVLLNQDSRKAEAQAQSPVKEISGTMTAWSHAGQAYRADSTIYVLPSGKVWSGSAIRDWDDLPAGTRLMVGYKGPYEITRQRTAYRIAGQRYRHRSVVYYLPGGRLVTGDQIKNFNDLPTGVKLYLPLSFGG